MPKLVATDLDGTLLRTDGTISIRTQIALERAYAAGLIVVLVTARPPRRVVALADKFGLRGVAICTNGALIYDLSRARVIRESRIEPVAAHEIVLALRSALPGCCFAVEAGLRYGQEPAYAVDSIHREGHDLLVDDAITLCSSGITKLIVRHRDYSSDELVRLASAVVGSLGIVTHSGAPFVEVSALGVTKATALATLCDEYHVAAEAVLVCGDMPNDIPMLAWAGQAVAVANAHPAVLAIADRVTASNNEDGVALVIESALMEQ
jgi:Cof subfamily protein (haloacid dehalogenase superfamily)